MPRVSVLINAFNSAATLGAAIDSALSQSVPDLELVVYDNGSTDGTQSIVRGYSDTRIRYIQGGQTVILGEARNRIMEAAQGEYLAFLDSDDVWLPRKLEKQIDLIERTGVGLVFTGAIRHHADDGTSIDHFRYMGHHPDRHLLFGDLLRCYTVVNSSVLFRREALESQPVWVDCSLRVCTDFDLFMRLIHCSGGDFVDDQLTLYNVTTGSTSAIYQDAIAGELSQSIDRMLAWWPEIANKNAEDLRAFRRNIDFQHAKRFWRNGRTDDARRYLLPHLSSLRCALAFIGTGISYDTAMWFWSQYQRMRRRSV